jgi:asparagine synthase (glutamine-hydrolysing)
MCGLIAGLLGTARISEDRVLAALDAIHHRGPDGRGTWRSDTGDMMLGHVQLSIIGLDNGDQPMVGEGDGVSAVVNGEFYGYREIRSGLRNQYGCNFVTDSDSEIALHLYRQHGLEFGHYLTGEFAAVIADPRRRRMVAILDRFGIKPLFYTVYNGNVLFASEIKALLALGVPARWDTHGFLADQFMVRMDQTNFARIYSVPPGCILVAEAGRVMVKRYWDTQFPTAETLTKYPEGDSATIAGFRAVFDECVADRLVADVEVACYLSGGIDSCSVLGVAQRRMARPIRAFTITFDDAVYDETMLAQKTAAMVGSTFEPVPVSQQQIADNFANAIWHAERQMFNGHGVAKFLLSEAVRNAGIKVVLTGEGSDEILAGYPPFRRDMLLYNTQGQDHVQVAQQLQELVAANQSSRGLLVADGDSTSALSVVQQRLGFVPSWMDAFGTVAAKLQPLMRASLVDRMAELDPHACFMDQLDIRGALQGRDAVNQSLYLWTHAVLSNFVLVVLADRMEMAHSIEGRVPFLDHRLAEYSAKLPVHYKIRGQKEKYVLREACKDVLLPEIYARPKHPFMSPPAKETGDAMATFVSDIIASSALDDQPFYNPKAVRALRDRATTLDPAERAVAEAPLLSVVSTVLMQQRFGLGA